MEQLTIAEELERKVVETMESLGHRVVSGEISQNEYLTALRTINDSTRGLIDPDINYAIDHDLNQMDLRPMARLFWNKDESMITVAKLNSDRKACAILKGRLVDFDLKVIKPPIDAVNPLKFLTNSMRKVSIEASTTGYKEIT